MICINQRICNLCLDWREAADLRQSMRVFKKENMSLMEVQSPAFKALWGAIEIACNRSVNEKRPIKDLSNSEEQIKRDFSHENSAQSRFGNEKRPDKPFLPEDEQWVK